jgi:RHS repeat-associated protein
VTEDGKTAVYAYDANGNRVSLTTSGAATAYTYNPANLITSLTNTVNGEVQSSYSYTYLRDGNQSGKTDHTGRTVSYTYDGSARLINETYPDSIITYTYDLAGNRASKTSNGETEFYSYDSNNRLLSVTNWDNETVFTYDANGNQLSKTVTGTFEVDEEDETSTYTYNARNQLTGFTDGTAAASYAYRPDGLRHSKTVNGVTTRHVLDGWHVIADITNGSSAYYTRGIGLLWDSEDRYYLFDAHGSVVGLAGSVSETAEYDAFGNIIGGSLSTPFGYSGEYFDAESGLIYLRARYYDPQTSRFLAEDPIRDGLNWYTYCYNNPIMWIDPSGLVPVLLTYIQAKINDSGGDMSHTVTETRLFGLSWTPVISRIINVTYNGQTFSYSHNQIGYHLIVDSDWLVRDFGLCRTLAEHQVGDGFFFIDDAALAWGLKYFPLSNDPSNRREYASNIYTRTDQIENWNVRVYYFGEPNIGTATSVRIPTATKGRTKVATIHSHPDVPGYASNRFSQQDLKLMESQGLPSYIATPNGRIQVADLNSRGRTTTRTVFRGIRW